MAVPLPFSSEDFFWINPCGILASEENDSARSMPIEELFDEIIRNSNTSHLQSKDFKSQILESKPGLNEDSLSDQQYDWLESPSADIEYFEGLSTEDALRDTYYLLQKFAVAFDQMTKDQEEKDYYEMLLDCKAKIIQLLCSFQTAMISLEMKAHPDASMDVMSDDLRTLQESGKHIRDLLIVRDYVKSTHYAFELLNYLKGRM